MRQVAQEILDDALRAPVDAVRAQRSVLGHRQVVGLAVDGRRRAEHQRRHPGLAHDLRERDGAAHVDVVVRERPRLGLADGLEARAMHDRGDRMVVEHRAQRGHVAHVGRHAGDGPPGDRLQPGQHRGRAVDEVVEHDRRVAGVREFDDDVRADVTRTAGHEDRLRHGFGAVQHTADPTRRARPAHKEKPGARPGSSMPSRARCERRRYSALAPSSATGPASGRPTSSTSAIGAASPWRKPNFRMRR